MMDFMSAFKIVRDGGRVFRQGWGRGGTSVWNSPADSQDYDGIFITRPEGSENYSPTVEDIFAKDWRKLNLEEEKKEKKKRKKKKADIVSDLNDF